MLPWTWPEPWFHHLLWCYCTSLFQHTILNNFVEVLSSFQFPGALFQLFSLKNITENCCIRARSKLRILKLSILFITITYSLRTRTGKAMKYKTIHQFLPPSNSEKKKKKDNIRVADHLSLIRCK